MKEEYIRHVLEGFALSENFDAKFGGQWIDSSQLAELTCDLSFWAFAEFGIDAKGRYLAQCATLINLLLLNNAIVQDGDEYSGFWNKLRPPSKAKFLQGVHEANPVTQRVSVLGDVALARALKRIAMEDGLTSLEGEPFDTELSDLEAENPNHTLVPASDRIVTRSDNQVIAEEVTATLEELATELKSDSNEVGSAFGDDRQLAISEVSQLSEMTKQPRFRSLPVVEFARKSLSWIAEKAGAAAVAELAKRVLTLILNWLA